MKRTFYPAWACPKHGNVKYSSIRYNKVIVFKERFISATINGIMKISRSRKALHFNFTVSYVKYKAGGIDF